MKNEFLETTEEQPESLCPVAEEEEEVSAKLYLLTIGVVLASLVILFRQEYRNYRGVTGTTLFPAYLGVTIGMLISLTTEKGKERRRKPVKRKSAWIGTVVIFVFGSGLVLYLLQVDGITIATVQLLLLIIALPVETIWRNRKERSAAQTERGFMKSMILFYALMAAVALIVPQATGLCSIPKAKVALVEQGYEGAAYLVTQYNFVEHYAEEEGQKVTLSEREKDLDVYVFTEEHPWGDIWIYVTPLGGRILWEERVEYPEN